LPGDWQLFSCLRGHSSGKCGNRRSAKLARPHREDVAVQLEGGQLLLPGYPLAVATITTQEPFDCCCIRQHAQAVAKNDFDAEFCNIIVKEHPELKELLESSLLRGQMPFTSKWNLSCYRD